MTLVVASAAVLGFALVLARSRLGVVAQRIVRSALDGVTAVLDPARVRAEDHQASGSQGETEPPGQSERTPEQTHARTPGGSLLP